jgi:hypothetical protein
MLGHNVRRADREAEGARLLSEYTPKAYLGFESLALRHLVTLNPGNLSGVVSFYSNAGFEPARGKQHSVLFTKERTARRKQMRALSEAAVTSLALRHLVTLNPGNLSGVVSFYSNAGFEPARGKSQSSC